MLIVIWISAAGTLFYTESKKAGKSVNTTEATRMMNHDNALVLDIRESKEFAAGHISGAINLPVSVLNTKLSEIEKHKKHPIIVVCKMGTAAGAIAKTLKKNGFDEVVRLSGGMSEWAAASLPVKKGKSS